MLKHFLICLLLTVFGVLNTSSQNLEIDDLRDEYLKALHDFEEAERVYNLFLKVENPSAKVLAYTGALEAIMTKTTWNIFKKVNYLNKSENSFNLAIEKDPNDVEIRFMRMAVQYEIPEYLGFSDDIETDRKFIVKHINKFNPSEFDHETLVQIFRFMKKCNHFTEAQIETFQDVLALKS